jgi:hypothetical protein
MTALRTYLVGAAGGLIITSSTLLAQTPAVDDVGCLLLSVRVESAAKPAELKQIGTAAKWYYLGRVSMLSQSQIQAGKRAFPKELAPGPANKMVQQCFQQMQSKGKNLEGSLK